MQTTISGELLAYVKSSLLENRLSPVDGNNGEHGGEHGPSDKLYGEASAFTGRVSEFDSHIRYFLLLVSWNATGFWLTLKGVDWRVHKRELWCASKRDLG